MDRPMFHTRTGLFKRRSQLLPGLKFIAVGTAGLTRRCRIDGTRPGGVFSLPQAAGTQAAGTPPDSTPAGRTVWKVGGGALLP